MTATPPQSLFLADEAATTALAERLAAKLPRGSVIWLSGAIGAGKSHFARAFIRARIGYAGDIPSPSFTLVQSYEGQGPHGPAPEEIWHSDLYRLSHPDEAEELGLFAAMDSPDVLVLIEWPDRLGGRGGDLAIRLDLAVESEGRRATLSNLPEGMQDG